MGLVENLLGCAWKLT
ncbi:unnamed protein product [Linum tenue]|uniref:Uncharacterized protein n=1 Tax=Linum tenue TaxID=586396 RepID=A0AAV0KCV5_9ROSI|nr:unnamed protein product [Linum tenue]CAI0420209.1 unnamed protein product [Linum tenue]